MFSGNRTIKIAIVAIVATISSLLAYFLFITPTDGSIVILENPSGTECSMEFKKWNGQHKCELMLADGDEIQVEISRESGVINMTISGKNGNEPYTGNDLHSGLFTVTISETDQYMIRLSGNSATGKVIVKNRK